jgi:uncharacterized protein with PIN domain
VTVLDASAIIAALLDEPARDGVEELLRAGATVPRVSAVNLGEIVDQMVRVRGREFEDVLDRLMWLAAAGLEIAEVDLESGALAGFLRSTHYRRRDKDLSMADCHALATALVFDDSLATSDPALAATARYEGVTVIALPDTNGQRPS